MVGFCEGESMGRSQGNEPEILLRYHSYMKPMVGNVKGIEGKIFFLSFVSLLL